jgi:hypothetical protein
MQDWSQPSTQRATDDAADRDPAQAEADPALPDPALPDPALPDPPGASPSDDPADWDELTPASTGPVPVLPPNDVLVAGSPLATPTEPPPYESAGTATDTAADTSRAITDEPAGLTAEPSGPADEPRRRAGESRRRAGESSGAVIDAATTERFQTRWHDVQFGFVDDPQEAIQQAGELATDVLTAFTEAINARKNELDDWRGPGGQPDTERLRLAVRAYREFVDRLLGT